MGLFDASEPKSKAELLEQAVIVFDTDASLKLLQDAGGACQARQLANEADKASIYVGHSVTIRGNEEDLQIFYTNRDTSAMSRPVAGIQQPKCEK